MAQRLECVLLYTALCLLLTMALGLLLQAGIVLVGLFLALLFLLPPLLFLSLGLTQGLAQRSPFGHLASAALLVQGVGLALVYGAVPSTSVLDFLRLTFGQAPLAGVLIVPFWLALPGTWWFLQRLPAPPPPPDV